MTKEQIKTQKLGMMACIMMAVGSIIGAGFFNVVPMAISKYVGNGIILSLIITAVITVIRTIPLMYLGSALPVTGGSYAYATRMFHPFLGYIQAIAFVTGILNIATMSLTAVNYLLPAFGIEVVSGSTLQIFSGIAIIVLFSVISSFGAKASGKLQNYIVIMNIFALSAFFIVGVTKFNPEYVSLSSLASFNGDTAAIQWSNLVACVGLLTNVIMGGNIVMSIAEEVENPGFNVPFSFFVGTGVATLFYGLCSIVAIGVCDPTQPFPGTLTTVAQMMWDNPIFYKGFSLLGGALAAFTTLNSSILLYSRLHFAVARDGFWPAIFAKTNKYKVPYISLWTCAGISIAFLLIQLATGDKNIISTLVSTTTVPGLLLGFIVYLPCVTFPIRYKNAAKAAWFKLPQWLNIGLCVLSTIIGLYLTWGIITRTQSIQYWINFGLFWMVFVVYYFIRVWYLKKYKNIDLVKNLKQPFPLWDVIEKEAAEQLKASGK